MRAATHDTEVHTDEKGRIIAVNLGWDFTAEHEWGMKGLHDDFGLNDKARPGIPRRKISRIREGRGYDGRSSGGLVLLKGETEYWDLGESTKIPVATLSYTRYGVVKDEELSFYTDYKTKELPDLKAAWSGGDFALRFQAKHEQWAQDLYDAFLKHDIAFLWGSTKGNPFSNAGLCLAIISRLSKEAKDALAEMHRDADKLAKAAKKTGIESKIDAVNKKFNVEHRGLGHRSPTGYFALSPRWKDETKKEVVFWLNPQEQQKNAAGWFTVAELEQWIEGKGPIVEKGRERQAKREHIASQKVTKV